MDEKLTKQINNLPLTPGVYLFKDKRGRILYIGKASNLRNRVKSYFKGPLLETRLNIMVEKIKKIDRILCDSEIEALVLESELIRRYKPKYNIEWKDDKNFLYIMITKEQFPRVEEVRPPLTEKAQYFGPFTDASAVKNTLKTLRRIFPYRSCRRMPTKACLHYFIKRCPSPCIGEISEKDYQKLIKNLIKILSGKKNLVIKQMGKEMKIESVKHKFEKAAVLRDRIANLKKINQTIIFDEASYKRIKSDEALSGLSRLLDLKSLPRRIEAYDVSNISGLSATGSMIVFEDGLPQKKEYKRFKIKSVSGIDDYKMIKEILERRFKQNWISPDLVIIDGGKGQLSTAKNVLAKNKLSIPVIGLAKREEEIVIKKGRSFQIIRLPKTSKILQLLQRIRDEAHRFAISYHTKLRSKAIQKSALDEIPGIGPKTKKVLLKNFSSIKNIKKAKVDELSDVIGINKTKLLKKYL